ncbi:MAG: hypothetical protein O2887_00105 [Bacteroidetes bacterium]|nr:hypothetical protein [Bacteroidota bacterium]MDA1118892.1 hypothetical protein [Bacteroidota bacterium]
MKNAVSCPVPQGIDDPQIVINTTVQTIEEVSDNDITAIGIGFPDLVDRAKGIAFDVPNIPL